MLTMRASRFSKRASPSSILSGAGCEVVQGYLFGRPAPLKIELGEARFEKREARIVSIH